MITFCPFPKDEPDHVSQRKRRVLIVDDNWFFAACLRSLIDLESDLVVCDTARSGQQLPERIEHYQPELLVIDLSLGAENGVELARQLRMGQVDTPIVFVSTLSTPKRQTLEAIGRCAYWRKGDSPRKFLRRLRAVLSAASEPTSGRGVQASAVSSSSPVAP